MCSAGYEVRAAPERVNGLAAPDGINLVCGAVVGAGCLTPVMVG